MMQPEEIQTALSDVSSVCGQHFYFRALITSESLKEVSDRKEGKGIKLSFSTHHTVLAGCFTIATNPYFLCWYDYPHTLEEEIQQS